MLRVHKIPTRFNNKGFIQLPFLLAIVVFTLVTSGIGYALYKQREPTEIIKPVAVGEMGAQEVLGNNIDPEKEADQQPPKATAGAPELSQLAGGPVKNEENVKSPKNLGAVNNKPPVPTIEEPKIYSIIPLGNISSFPERERLLWTDAYNEFLQTHNLQYMNYEQQKEFFLKIVERYYARYKQELEREIQQQQDYLEKLKELNSDPEQKTQPNPEIEAKLSELRQTLDHIQNQPVAMSVIEGKKQRAYQDWVKNNPEVYSKILGSSYINDLNAILKAYGLN